MTAMQQQSAKLQQTQLQITTGLKILRPSDDPSGSVKVLNLNANMGEIEQFNRNLSVARSELSHQESVLESINESLQRVRELTVQANNPTNHDSARLSIAMPARADLAGISPWPATHAGGGDAIMGDGTPP